MPKAPGTKAYLLDDAEEIDSTWFEGVENVGITAGASAPEILVEEIVDRLRDLGADEVRTLGGTPEDVKFPLPKGLWQKDVDNAAKIPSAQISAPFGSIRMDFQDGRIFSSQSEHSALRDQSGSVRESSGSQSASEVFERRYRCSKRLEAECGRNRFQTESLEGDL